jgi:hypothetical protein
MSRIRQDVELDGILLQKSLRKPCRVPAVRIFVSELNLDVFVKTQVIEIEAESPDLPQIQSRGVHTQIVTGALRAVPSSWMRFN